MTKDRIKTGSIKDKEIRALQDDLDQAVKEVSEARAAQRKNLERLARRVRRIASLISNNITED